MNFFGHAYVAQWTSGDPRFALGAMLPDFEGMARTRLVENGDPTVAFGIRHHHATDAVFHAAPDFVALIAFAGERLRAMGLGRGSARAVAHVGTELFLDGRLVEDRDARDRYVAAVEGAGELPLRFADSARWAAFRARLRSLGPPLGYADPSFVGDRLVGILAPRPRLALDEPGARAMRRFLPALQRAVDDRADALLAHLAERLGEDVGAESGPRM